MHEDSWLNLAAQIFSKTVKNSIVITFAVQYAFSWSNMDLDGPRFNQSDCEFHSSYSVKYFKYVDNAATFIKLHWHCMIIIAGVAIYSHKQCSGFLKIMFPARVRKC